MLPGAVLLLVATVLLSLGTPLSASALGLLFYVGIAAGILLSVRFRSGRALLALLFIFLSERAIAFFSPARMPMYGPGRIALEEIFVLLPINFLVLTLVPEFALRLVVTARLLAVVLFESIFIAVTCRTGEVKSPAFIRYSLFPEHAARHAATLPQLGIFAFIICVALLSYRVLRFRKPMESGMLWSLVAAFIALAEGGIGHIPAAYFATSVLIIAGALIEGSYVLAYQDELTGLPGRRAYNELRMSLESPYTIAVVDIDHFKSFNDTYGHDTGDQVLRMVAGKLAQVKCGGKAFRVGGEEFAIVFRGKTLAETSPHLERLRAAVECATFHVRTTPERREIPRAEPDRRSSTRKKKTTGNLVTVPSSTHAYLSVTVSIGAAEPVAANQDVSSVYEAADMALYRAKKTGRNRVELATRQRTRKPRAKASIA